MPACIMSDTRSCDRVESNKRATRFLSSTSTFSPGHSAWRWPSLVFVVLILILVVASPSSIMSCAPSERQVSPKKPRASSERRPLVPVTPQRINTVQKKNRFASSPLTPNSSIVSSPFTPITNMYSSTSTFATPTSSVSSQSKFDVSPTVLKFKSKSLADTTSNWRTRAKENGIKVSADEALDGGKLSTFISLLETELFSKKPKYSPKVCSRTLLSWRGYDLTRFKR